VRFLRNDFTFTKRQLGWLMIIGGVLVFVGIMALNVIRQKPVAEIGPAQQLVFALCALIALIGATLIPLGDSSA
jgi:hypothetical protein